MSLADDQGGTDSVLPGRLDRLRAELHDEGVPAIHGAFEELAALVELAYALRPPAHEGRAPAYGVILRPEPIEPAILELGPLDHTLVVTDHIDAEVVRRFADGLRTFVVRDETGLSQLVCFGRAMSREYDLVMLQELLGGLIVQRHPTGQVRTYGPEGVVRWDGIAWYHDEPINDLHRDLSKHVPHIPAEVLRVLLLFAIHELSPRRIGATLVWRPDDGLSIGGRSERRYSRVPGVGLSQPGGPAAIANVLAQTDGAAFFDDRGEMVALGVHLVPSDAAKEKIDLVGGTRHSSALRYSFDDLDAVVIVVSESGPVSVMHAGQSLRTGTDDDLIG